MKLLSRKNIFFWKNFFFHSFFTVLALAFVTASAATKVPKWESLECEVKFSEHLHHIVQIWSTILAGGAQVSVLRHDPHLGRRL